MASIELRGVDKVYRGGTHAVRALDLRVDEGERMVLLGPSGCGKSTVLRLVAGLESPTAGEIHVGDRRVDHEPPQNRNLAMVFQGYALYGHMTVRRNLEFPLRMRSVARKERARRVREVAAMLELEAHLDARPGQLSGGQQQRVAMGRALVREPEVFLLDEPLSNLDARLRTQVRAHIARIQDRLGVTTLYVTHDQVEALTLGHRIAVLRDGRLQQVGTGKELYRRPANTFVAGFLGQPGMNFVTGRLRRTHTGFFVDLGPGTHRLTRAAVEGAPAEELNSLAGRAVIMGVRPEALRITSTGEGGAIQGRVETVEWTGRENVVHVASALRTVDPMTDDLRSETRADGGPPIILRLPADQPSPSPGNRVTLQADPEGVRVFRPDGNAVGGPAPVRARTPPAGGPGTGD